MNVKKKEKRKWRNESTGQRLVITFPPPCRATRAHFHSNKQPNVFHDWGCLLSSPNMPEKMQKKPQKTKKQLKKNVEPKPKEAHILFSEALKCPELLHVPLHTLIILAYSLRKKERNKSTSKEARCTATSTGKHRPALIHSFEVQLSIPTVFCPSCSIFLFVLVSCFVPMICTSA